MHFERDGKRFQDDHDLPQDLGDFFPDPSELFAYERTVHIPVDTKPGVYDILLGEYHPARPKEGSVSARTKFPNDKGRITLPVSIQILSPDSS